MLRGVTLGRKTIARQANHQSNPRNFILKRESVAPEIVKAWSDCIATVFSHGLRCSVTATDAETGVVSVKFTPLDESDTLIPEVRSSAVVGAVVVNGNGLSPGEVFKVGTKIPQNYVTALLQRNDPARPVSICVNTSRGSVWAQLPAVSTSYRVRVTISPIGSDPRTVVENMHVDDGSDDCDVNENRTARYTY